MRYESRAHPTTRRPRAGAGNTNDADPRRPPAGARPRSAGFSLVEMLVAMTVLTVVMGAALGVFRTESDAFREGIDRMEVLQNVRFGANAVEKDLKTTGANTPGEQPRLVYADEDVVVFNADFVTNVDSDPQWAVYYDPDAPDDEVLALEPSQQITVPNGSFDYPGRDYDVDGSDSPAETISFYFRPDSSTDRSDDWALFRKVNAEPAQLVSRHMLQVDGSEPFFEYHKLASPGNAPDSIATVQPGELPLAHTVETHGSPADTFPVDSVRAVRLRIAATNGETGDAEEVRSVSRLIRIPNMGVKRKRVCGSTPVGGQNFTATPEVNSGASTIFLEWEASQDQESGEKDVARYLVWKKKASETDWGPPLVSVPVSGTDYSYRDAQVTPNEDYDYELAAQDCTPSLSPKATVGPVTAPDP